MQSRLKLSPGETLQLDHSKSKGFMGETEIDHYTVLDSAGNVAGSVVHTVHTAVNGFRVTNTLVQKDQLGHLVVDASW